MHKIIHTYKPYLSSERNVLLYFSSLHNVLKSMAFVSGGVQKGFGLKTLIAPLCKFFLESTVFDQFSVYCQV